MQQMISHNCTITKLVLITTNRFDYVVEDKPVYYDLVKKLAADERIEWVANNPVSLVVIQWESAWARHALNGNFLDFRLIRPFGYSSLPEAANISGASDRVAYIE